MEGYSRPPVPRGRLANWPVKSLLEHGLSVGHGGPPLAKWSVGCSPVDLAGRLADAQAVTELLEGHGVAHVGGVQVLRLSDEPEAVVASHAGLPKDAFEWLGIAGVDDEHLVLVELELDRFFGGHHGDAGAAVIEQQVVEVVEMTQEDGQVDVLSEQVAVAGAAAGVAGLQDDIHDRPKRIEQVEEEVEESLARDGGGQHRDVDAGPHIVVAFEAVALAWDDLELGRRPDCLRQAEVAVAVDPDMLGQDFGSHVYTCGSDMGKRGDGRQAGNPGERLPAEI